MGSTQSLGNYYSLKPLKFYFDIGYTTLRFGKEHSV